MKLKLAFNPVEAYRAHGQRYSIYVATQLFVTIGVLVLALITILGNVIDFESGDLLFRVGLWLANSLPVFMTYIALEFCYWKLRLNRLETEQRNLLTTNESRG